MEILRTEFEGRASQRGWIFEQIIREGNIAIYLKRDTETGKIYYEVIVIQYQKEAEGEIAGKKFIYAEKERYPNDEQFGTDGWCYTLFERAEVKYEKLLKEESEKVM